jgi:hypothetical protein
MAGVKLFVFNRDHDDAWGNRADNGALTGARKASWGRAVVVRRERRVGELPSEQVRDIEFACVAAGVGLMALAALVQIALNVLKTL